MIYAKNSKTTVNSFSTYLSRLWIKFTVGLKQHDLYQLSTEKTLHEKGAHKCHKHTQLCVHPSCHLPHQITTIAFENNLQGLCKFI